MATRKSTDWKAAAAALDPAIPTANLEKIIPALEAMEARFRPIQLALLESSGPEAIFDPWSGPEDLA